MAVANREKSLLSKLCEITTRQKAYWILYKYGMYSAESYEDFARKFLQGSPKEVTDNYIYEEEVQQAIKRLMKIMHGSKMINLYDTYYAKALAGDVNSAKFLMDFSKEFFKDDKDELMGLLEDVRIDEDE